MCKHGFLALFAQGCLSRANTRYLLIHRAKHLENAITTYTLLNACCCRLLSVLATIVAKEISFVVPVERRTENYCIRCLAYNQEEQQMKGSWERSHPCIQRAEIKTYGAGPPREKDKSCRLFRWSANEVFYAP